jgi:hypothetical protein
MSPIGIKKHNVGRIAERIVANELEYNGYRVSDLNKDGKSDNVDLLASKDGRTWQIQVKGAAVDDGWWVNYGFCDLAIIAGEKPMFNRVSGFYKAQVVVLVAVKSPAEYRCVVLPVKKAEKAAQLNLNHDFRRAKKDGSPKKPGRVSVWLGRVPKARDIERMPFRVAEQELLNPHIDNWNLPDVPADS